MYLLVYKFGGSSVADAAGLRCAAGQLAEAAAAGFHIIAVVSAQGKTTDRLLQSTAELTAHPACREADQLLATGEQASAALMAMTLQEMGLPAVSLTGWQAGIHTDGNHAAAEITALHRRRILRELEAGKIVIVAVILVILATYLIMISGSVLLCRQLQKNTAYYYNPRHFVSVSSMAYRMKRNGAGLASVCILATMVLVMLSSTTSLYFGAEDSLMARYPRELSISYGVEDVEYLSDSSVKELREEILSVLEKENCTPQNVQDWRSLRIYGYLNSTRADFERTDEESQTIYQPDGEIYNFVFVSALDYNALTGENVTLDPGEAAVYTARGPRFSGKEVDFGYGLRYDVAGYLDTPLENGSIAMDIAPTLVLVVPDLTEAEHGLAALGQYPACRWNYGFDTGLPAEKQAEISNSLYDANIGMHDDYTEAHGIRTRTIECRTMNEADFFGTYGGLFCLGIILSVEFLFAAVLIIYYKQISEGYEDQSRFGIMQKVGMTKTEIRRSINSQLLTVFYLPLVMAGLHLAFAFPMIRRLLLLFNLNNVGLFALTTVISFVMFGVLYALIYRITGNVYYRIVSDIHDRE